MYFLLSGREANNEKENSKNPTAGGAMCLCQFDFRKCVGAIRSPDTDVSTGLFELSYAGTCRREQRPKKLLFEEKGRSMLAAY